MKKTNLYILLLAGVLGAFGVTTFATRLSAAEGAESATANPALTSPVKSAFDHYLKIQAALASDSLTGVAENAKAIAKAVQGEAKILPASVGAQAEALAQAPDLSSARAAFKPLSDTLIKYLADNHAKDAYVQVYCPMAQARWLQKDQNVNNPYMGKDMSGCGEIQK